MQAVGCFRSAGNVWVASSDVRLNGVLLEPTGGKQVNPPQIGCGSSPACSGLLADLGKGNKLYLAKNAARLGTTGKWRMSAGPMNGLYKGVLDVSNIDWNASKPLMSLGADASVDLLDFPLAGKFSFTPHEDGSSRLGLLVGMPVVMGGVTGETAVKINPGGAILNNDGIAACGHAAGFGVGGYFVWRTGEPEDVWYCDLAKLRADLAKSTTLAADGRIPVAVPADEDQAAVRFVGENGQAPQVRLYGPDGRVIETPGPGVGNASDETKSWLSFRDELHGNADVLLADTDQGEWSYELMPGSPPIAEVQTAGELPDPKVKATVTRVEPRTSGKRAGKKARRKSDGRFVLRWKLRRIPGQRVIFSEEGRGVPPRIIARTGKAKGATTFKPHLLPQRGRRVVATVEQHGKPRDRFIVAHYRAPRPPKANRVKRLRATRRGGRVVVRWASLRGAASYRVYAIGRDGRREFQTTKRSRLVLRGKEARRLRTVAVQPVSGSSLEPGKKSRVKPRKRRR